MAEPSTIERLVGDRYQIIRELGAGAFGTVYLARGVTLDELLRTNDRFDPEEARRVLIEIADALAYAHSEGVLHRDLKPENVFLERAGAVKDPAPPRVRLIDFGVAAFPGRDQGVNATYETWGTPRFMAPEQLLGERQLDPRTDIYALGMLGYLRSDGRPPAVAPAPSGD